MRNAKRYLFLLSLFIFFGLGATFNRSQPPLGRTGAPGESTCANGCHGTSVNTGPGNIALGLPANYTPGQTYSLNLQLTDNTRSRFGFEMTALNSSNAAAGSFSVASGNATIRSANISGGIRQYIHHSNASSNNSWSINWTAPSSQAGPITFYVAGNAANGNNGTSGDNIYTSSFSLSPAPQPPIAAFSMSKNQICEGENITFQNQSSGSISSYSWDFGQGASPATATGPGPHQVTYSTVGSPQVRLSTLGPGGTSSDSSMLDVFSPPVAVILGTFAPQCEGSPITFTADPQPTTSSFSYLWSTGDTNRTTSVSASTTLELAVTDQNGCKDTTSLALIFNSPPVPVFQGLDTAYCLGFGDILLTGVPSGGLFSGNGLLPGDIFNPDSAGPGSHTITYGVVDSLGCEGTTSQSVLVNETPEITGSNLPDSLCVNDASIALQSMPTGGIFSGTGVTNNAFDPAAAGPGAHQLQLIVTAAEGCADTASFSVTVNDLPVASIVAGPNGTIETQSGFTRYIWAFVDTIAGSSIPLPGFNMPVFDPTPFANSPSNTGVMAVTVTDSLGCSGTSEAFALPSTAVDPLRLSEWKIFPNPTTHQLHVQFQFHQRSDVQIEVVDARGTVLLRRNFRQSSGEFFLWDMSSLAAGMYFVRLRTEWGVIVKKVAKR